MIGYHGSNQSDHFSRHSFLQVGTLVGFSLAGLLGVWLATRGMASAEPEKAASGPKQFGEALPAGAGATPLSPESQKVYEAKVKPFLRKYCLVCHEGDDASSNFPIDSLGTDFLKDKTGDHWKEIYDRVLLGDKDGVMPPKKRKKRPDPQEVAVVTDWIEQERRNAEKRAKNLSGRIQMRRLNRTELANCLRDLFDLDETAARSLENQLQADSTIDGFDRISASLFIDDALLHKYYELYDILWDRYLFASKPNTRTAHAIPSRDINYGQNWNTPKESRLLKDPMFIQGLGRPLKDTVTVPTGATIHEFKGDGIEYLAATTIGRHDGFPRPWFAGGGTWAQKALQIIDRPAEEGLYRFKIVAGAFPGRGKHAVDEVKIWYEYGESYLFPEKKYVTIDAPLDKPKLFEMTVFLRKAQSNGYRPGSLKWNGPRVNVHEPPFDSEFFVLNEPGRQALDDGILKTYNQFKSDIEKARRKGDDAKAMELDREMKEFTAKSHEKFRKYMDEYAAAKKPAYVYNPNFPLDSIPRLRVMSLEVEGPIAEWPAQGRTRLFFDGDDGAKRPIDAKYIREIFARFLPRAFRRPVEAEEIDDWVSWVLRLQEKDRLSGIEAVKKGVKAVLCSPEFLFIQEPEATSDAGKPRPLNEHELASRLSFFLWSSMPDDQLLKLAAAGKLHEPQTLAAQVRRMLADPRGMGFVRNFTGQWLKVRDFDKTVTDLRFRSYSADVRKASWQEPYEFFNEVLSKDLSILNFIDSDFVMINAHLAKHYGIEGVTGEHFRRVPIRPEHHRGGVLGMAGVLTYLTDGMRSLPVRRGAYVLDTLWNEPPKPPPPGAGDLPMIRGAMTIRDRLVQHKSVAICASCHAKIDPFGMALENYNAIGAWRERQRPDGFDADARSPLLDVSGELPSSSHDRQVRNFNDLQEYKQALLAKKGDFVHGFTEKMLTYALGRSMSRSVDGAMIAAIVRKLEQDQYRMQSLVQAIVASEAFRTK
jgi:hypothetical protein